jgi:hypothetical protein
MIDAQKLRQCYFSEVAFAQDGAVDFMVDGCEQPGTDQYAYHAAQQSIQASLADGTSCRSWTITQNPESDTEDEPADDARSDSARFWMQLGESHASEQVDTDHSGKDCAEHYLDNGEVLKEQLPDDDIVSRHTAFLEKEAETNPEQQSEDKLHILV